ncbi:MAG: hypothetical protein ACR2N9_04250 [Acidimicrobiia bacterium]
MTHSHSDIRDLTRTSFFALGLVAVLAVLLPTLSVFGALITTDRYIVREEAPVTEDQYVTSTSALIEGTLDGDLTVFSGSLTISGTVTGNVTVFSAGSVIVEESGSIDGSLNGAATSVSVRGTVGSDVFVAAGSTVVEDTGSIGRDVMGFGGTVRIDGSVGRDVRGRAYRTTVDGTVSGDVDIATQTLGIASTAVIGGDVLYRSASEASIADGATIGGTVTQLPAQSNFLYGIVLAIANIVGFLGFIASGLVVLWLARSTGSRAVGSVLTKPLRSFLVGVATVIVLPLLIGLLAVTLVGIPLAIVLGAIGVILFIVGAVPSVTALGHLVLVKRGGLFGAFLVGAVLWRLSIFIPWVGPFLFLIALVWGVGAWVMGVLAARRADPLPPALVPAALVARGERTPDWEPPLAPGTEVAAHVDSPTEIEDEVHDASTGDQPPSSDEPPDAEASESASADAEFSEADVPASGADEAGFGFRADDEAGAPERSPDDEADDDGSGIAATPAVVGDRVVFGSAAVAGAAVAAGAASSDEDADEEPGTGQDIGEDTGAVEAMDEDGAPPDQVSFGDTTVDAPTENARRAVPRAIDEPMEEVHAETERAEDGIAEDELVEDEPAQEEPAEDEPAAADTGDLSGLTLSERFAALREELLTTGTVEPVEQAKDGADGSDDDSPSDDWEVKS